MELQEVKDEVKRHVKAAYALLPDNLTSPTPYLKKEHLDSKFNAGEWRQVCYSMQSHSRVNNFSPELLEEISFAAESIKLLDCMVFKAVMEQMFDNEKDIIGEGNTPAKPD